MTDKRRPGHAPAFFDDAAFADDLRRASAAGVEVAKAARARYERDGVPVQDLRACEAEGPEGTRLENCMKAYLDRGEYADRVPNRG